MPGAVCLEVAGCRTVFCRCHRSSRAALYYFDLQSVAFVHLVDGFARNCTTRRLGALNRQMRSDVGAAVPHMTRQPHRQEKTEGGKQRSAWSFIVLPSQMMHRRHISAATIRL